MFRPSARAGVVGCLLVAAACATQASSSNEEHSSSAATPEAGSASNPVHDASVSVSPDASSDVAVDAAPSTGTLVGGPGPWPGAIAGVPYRAGGQSGVTDAQGRFQFRSGDAIAFTLGGVERKPVPARPMMSAFDLAGSHCHVDDDVRAVLVEIEKLVAGDGGTEIDPARATQRFIGQIASEVWNEDAPITFDSVASATRSQGIVYDGSGFLFSWTLGFDRTDLSFHTTASKSAAIPLDMLIAGSNHIGDVDLHAGTLYAPIEDGSDYQHPTIVLFDAQTLTATGARFPLPTSLLTKGVPWVAVDGAAGVAFVAEWDPTPAILVLDLQSFAYERSIVLDQTLGRIQGAKAHGGALYAAADDDQKSVYKIDLDTGTVLPLFAYGASAVRELEGLTLVDAPAGTDLGMRVLGVATGGSNVTMHTHTRTRAPLRDALCAP